MNEPLLVRDAVALFPPALAAHWGNEDTAKILEILRKHDIHVTFFMTGGWVSLLSPSCLGGKILTFCISFSMKLFILKHLS